MEVDFSKYCMKYNCGLCCERGFDIFVTQADIKKWEQKRPEILTQITTKIIDGEEKKVIKKKKVIFPDGKTRNLCFFYDFEKKCLIHDVNPEICRRFICLHHSFFLFLFFYKISDFIEEFGAKIPK